MLAIIFGSNGQDGYYLNKVLAKHDVATIMVSRNNAEVIGDVSEYSFVEQIICEKQPDFIFHFAANSSTKHDTLFENNRSISLGTLNILEAVRLRLAHARVFLSGSAMQFKNSGSPIDENTPFDASSPYAVARIQSTFAARYFRAKFGMRIYVGFFFNHDSPRRTIHHVNQKIVRTVQEIARNGYGKLFLGNIRVKKEFNHAEDMMHAVWILVNQERISEAVLGSGKAYSIQSWVEYCFHAVGKNWEHYTVLDPSFRSEYDTLVSNSSLIRSLGWTPTKSFTDLADEMLKNEVE